MIVPIEVIVFWILFGLIGAVVGQKKGINTGIAFLGGLFLGPLSFLMVFVSSTVKKCPMCSEQIQIDALVCKHCKHSFSTAINEQQQDASDDSSSTIQEESPQIKEANPLEVSTDLPGSKDAETAYKAGYNYHYNQGNPIAALPYYREILVVFPSAKEAGYSRSQIKNILNSNLEINNPAHWEDLVS